MAKNPYKYKGPLDPVKDKNILVPRNDDLDRITEKIKDGQYWAIFGLRQIGKTTFLRQLRYRFKGEYIIYINFEVSPRNEEHFYQWLMEIFIEQIPAKSMEYFKEKWKNYSPDFRFLKFLEHFSPKDNNKKIIMLIDEFESIPSPQTFLHIWRKVYHERYDKKNLERYSIIISGGPDLIFLSKGKKAPFNIAEYLYIKDFSREESEKLIDEPITKLHIRIESTAKKKLISMMSGHPQMLQHACYLLVNIAINKNKVIVEKDVDDITGIILKESLSIATLKEDIQNNRTLETLVRDILKGKKKPYVPYKEYSIIGAGCIVEDENSHCAIRNKVYERFLSEFLSVSHDEAFIQVDYAHIKTEKAKEKWDKAAMVRGIPYGVGNYEDLRERNFYYVDKTRYLREIEKAGLYLFFIRPRRFGKTLFLTMMEAYYDVNRKSRFGDLFKGTAIFENPTNERHSYLVLKFDFSKIVPSITQVEESFLNHVQNTVKVFVNNYKDYLDLDVEKTMAEMITNKNPSDLLSSLLTLCKIKKQKLYLIIDEYDNFANTILSTAGRRDYEKITRGEGFFRSFFSVIKSDTTGSEAPISRLFMTGVSPITLDDVTSGFNIGLNISIHSPFNEIMGFNQQEVINMMEYYRQAGKIKHDTGHLLEIMSQWYNHYRFSKESPREVFNSAQVWYFLSEYFVDHEIPDDLIDRNMRIDYDKLKHLMMIDKGGAKTTNGNFFKIRQAIEKGFVKSKIEKGFSIKKLINPENFYSLLFFFGLLTIAGKSKGGQVILKIPNETVKRLFYEYITEIYTETEVFSLDLDRYTNLMEDMAYKGKWQPVLRYITDRMKSSMSLRDLIRGEKSVQAFLVVYLGLSNFYIIHSEKELNKGYGDIAMEPFTAKYEGIKYSYLIEIKYLGRTKNGAASEKREIKIRQLKEEAEKQLHQYEGDEKFNKTIEKTKLMGLVLIFSGHELVYMGEVSNGPLNR